jgi:hypothetical protein
MESEQDSDPMKRKITIAVLGASLVLITGPLVERLLVRPRLGGSIPQAQVLDDGLAIWPADTLEEARAECPSPFLPSWRHSAEDTVARYAQDLLGIDDPRRVESGRVAPPLTYVDIYAKGIPLYHFATVRRSGPCWYVTGAANRESFCCMGSTGYAGSGAARKLFLHVNAAGNWEGDARLISELGFGDRVERFTKLLSEEDTTTQITIPAPPGSHATGHYHLALVDDADGMADIPEGGPVGAPPATRDGTRAPDPLDAKQDVLEAARGPRRCDDAAFWAGFSPRSVVRHTLESAAQDSPLGNQKPGYQPRKIRVRHDGDLVVTADDAKVLFDFWSIRRNCLMLGRIQPLSGQEGVREVRVIGDAFAFDLDRGRATDVWIDFGFFGKTGSGMVSPIDDPVIFDAGGSFKTDRPGFYETYFFEGGRLISIESGALPPLDSF